MRLATANIWGLPAPISWPPRHVRFPRVRRFIEDTSSRALDVVLLQEHWRVPFRPRAFAGLDLITPRDDEGNSGLALSTRHRVLERAHGTFVARAAHVVERRFSAKGWQRVALEIEGVRLEVINTHLEAHAGPRHAEVRARQIDELLALVATISGPVLLAGDFNMHSEVASDALALQKIGNARFDDVVAAFDATPTYDRAGQRERFDRVFVRGLVCTGARVEVGAGLADHRPVIVEIDVARA